MAIAGVDCGWIKMHGSKITKVTAPNGEESKLYKDIVSHLKDMDPATREALRDAYRSWQEEGIVNDLDDNRNLAHAIWAQTHSPNFKKWFGDSKVVDENGEPLIVYHGSNKHFISFFKKEDEGLYFTDSKKVAENYANVRAANSFEVIEGKVSNKPVLYPVFLNIRNPKIIEDTKHYSELGEFTSWLSKGLLKEDGIIALSIEDNTGLEKQLVVVNPNQIKSLFNQGQFSVNKGEHSGVNWRSESFSGDYGDFQKRRDLLKEKGARDIQQSGNSIRYIADPDNIYFQSGDTISSRASLPTVQKVKDWMSNKGVDFSVITGGLHDELDNPIPANETVDVINMVVQVVQGHEQTAIPEAGMHIAARIIRSQQPKLFKEMMNKIGSYDLYTKTLGEYKKLKNYQNPDGSPNIPKIKEETIGKVLAEYYILDQEGYTDKPELIKQSQTWWQKIVDFLKSFFIDNPFEQAVKQFNEGKIVDNKPLKRQLYDSITKIGSEDSKDPIKAASNYLRKNEGEGQENGSGYDSPTVRDHEAQAKRAPDEKDIIEFAIENGLWENIILEELPKFDYGAEAEVYLSRDKKNVLKTNNLRFYNSWQDYLTHLQIHNYLFPSLAFKLKGFREGKMDYVESIVEQKLIEGSTRIGDEEMSRLLEEDGWSKYEGEGSGQHSYINKDLGIILYDMHGKNSIITDDGDLAFIDTQLFTTEDFYKPKEGDTFYQATQEDEGQKIYDRIKDQASRMRKIVNDQGETEHRVKDESGKEWKPEDRVTDWAKAEYKKKFGDKFESNRDPEKEKADRENGTRFHSYIENFMDRYVDNTTGLKRDTPEKRTGTIAPGEEHIYGELENYMKQVLNQFPDNTKFLWEVPVYMAGKKKGDGDVAGTIDFMTITPDGTVYKKDWKFMTEKGKEDISAITQKAHRIQMGVYGTILRKGYGVQQIRESNTVPFRMLYDKKDKNKVVNIVVGDTNYQNINDKTLLPVVSEQVQTASGGVEDPKMTSLVKNLNNLLEKLEVQKVTPKHRQEQDKKIQDLSYAIRTLVLKKSMTELSNVALGMVNSHLANLKEVQKFVNDTEKLSNISEKDAGRLAGNILDALEGLETFENLKNTLNDYTTDMPADEKQRLYTVLDRINSRAVEAENMLFDRNTGKGILEKLSIKVGDTYGIYNLLSKDKTMDWFQKNLNTSASATFKTAQLWFQVRNKTENEIALKNSDEHIKLQDINKRLVDWMGGSWDQKKVEDLLFKKDSKGRWKPFLINKIDSNFYKELSKRLEKPQPADRQWILSNIDVKAYKEHYQEDLGRFIEWAEHNTFDALSYIDPGGNRAGTLDQEYREKAIEQFKDRYDIDRTTAFSVRNDKLRNYPTDANWSSEYKRLREPSNSAAGELYDHIVDLNKRARKAGILSNYYYHFFPQVRRSTMDLLFDGGTRKDIWRSLISPFVTEAEENGYRDPITGEPINIIHARFTSDLGEGDDYGMVSNDIMKSLQLYTGEIIAYEEKSKIEGIAKMLKAVQTNKKVLVYNKGNLIKNRIGEPRAIVKEKELLKWLDDQINFDLYGIKHPGEDPGINITIDGKKMHISGAKAVDSIVQMFTLKTLGMNPGPALANLFGGAANEFINTGRHFTRTELIKAYKHVLEAKFYTEEGKKFVSLYEHFVPFTEDINRHFGKELSKKQVITYLSGEGLMWLMRGSDNIVQMANADVYFQNTMIEDGKLVNIREYAKSLYDYDNLYKKSKEERDQIRELIDKKVHELQSTRNLYNDKSIKFDDDSFHVKWDVERASESEILLRQRIQQLTRDCLGNRTPDELAHINMTLYGSALMTFRNWVPRLFQKRYGQFRYNPGSGTYEMGRMRMVGQVLMDDTQWKIKNLRDMLSYAHLGGKEDNLIGIAKKQYQKRLQEEREKEEVYEGSMFERTVSEAQFIDQYLGNVKAQIKELEMTAVLMAAFFSALSWAKTLSKDDDYPERGLAKWSVKMLDKFSDELGFFYSYGSFKGIVGSGNIVPMLSTLTDLGTFLDHMVKEGYYDFTGNEEAAEKNKLLKYPLNYIPVVNQFSSYFGMLNEQWGDVIGYKQQVRYNTFGR